MRQKKAVFSGSVDPKQGNSSLCINRSQVRFFSWYNENEHIGKKQNEGNKEEINSTPSYAILVDSRKPKFTKQNPKTITKSPGDTITWQATDNDQIVHYQITWRDQKTTTAEAQFTLPDTLEKTNKLIIRAYDRAGNMAKSFEVRRR